MSKLTDLKKLKVFQSSKQRFPIFFLVFFVFFLPPFFFNLPGTGLDPSWMIAMREAFSKGMMFGREVIFTYGPLAFLSTRVIEQHFVPLLLTYDALIASSLAFFFLVLLQKAVRKMEFFAIAALALATKHALFCYPTATAFTVFLFWLYYSMESKSLFAFGLACLFGLILFFVKINYGFVTLPVLGLFILSQVFWGQMSFRVALFSIVILLSSLVAGCFFLYVDLIGYVLNGFEIISGYNDNMTLPHSNNSKPLLNVVVIGASFTGLLLLHFRKLISGRQGIFYVAATGLCLFILWKNSFTRHSEFYELGFTFCAPLMLAAFYRFNAIIPANQGLGLMVASLVLPTSILIGGEMTWGRKEAFGQLPINYAKQIMDALRATPRHPEEIQRLRKLPPRILEKLGNSTVEIMPSDISLADLNDLNFTMRPIPQGYSAYTLKLDLKNADFFLSEIAPQFILFVASGLTAIDGKHGFWDESNTKKAILSRYELVDDFEVVLDFWGTGVYQGMERVLLLEKRAEPLVKNVLKSERFQAEWNRPFPVPTDDSFVYLQADINYSIAGRLLGILHQAAGINIKVVYSDGEATNYRSSPSMLKTGLLVSKRCDDCAGIKDMFATLGKNAVRVESIEFLSPSPWAFQKEIPARWDFLDFK